MRLFESMLGFDSMEVAHNDYSVKPQRFLKALEQLHMELLQEITIFPLFYGFMPNLGLYYRPDGSFENPSDLLPLGKIPEARRTQEEALEKCMEDCIEMSDCMLEMGADGIDYDTVASTGDAEFLAVLQTTEHVANETGLPVEIGMSAEMVLGFHGELEYNGKRLAGLWPHQQLQLCEEAGVRHLRPGRQHQHQEDRAVEPRAAPSPSSRPAPRSPRSRCTPTWAWASAACRCSRRRPSTS